MLERSNRSKNYIGKYARIMPLGEHSVNVEEVTDGHDTRYKPSIRGQDLRLSFQKRKYAEVYANMVLVRYIAKLKIAKENE